MECLTQKGKKGREGRRVAASFPSTWREAIVLRIQDRSIVTSISSRTVPDRKSRRDVSVYRWIKWP